MEENRKSGMIESEKEIVYSQTIKAGKRIYYIDVKKNRKDEMYISITESKKIVQGEGEGAAVSFEKHKIFLYREDFGNFIDGLTRTIKFIHEAEKADADAPAVDEGSQNESQEDFKIEF